MEVNLTIFRTDLNFLTLARRKKIPGGFSSPSQCSLPGPDISQPTLEHDKCSPDESASLLCVRDGGDGGDGGDGVDGVDGVGVKKIPPKVAPKPRHSLIIQLGCNNRR